MNVGKSAGVTILATTMIIMAQGAVLGAPLAPPSTTAKLCLNCHKGEDNNLRGHWESVAMKSSSLQLKIDDRSEVLKFQKGALQVLNAPETGDLEKMLRSIKKGHEVRVEYTEKDGVKYASVVAAKPPVKLSEAEKVSLAEVERLVALGPEKGNYTLIDSRPAPRFKEGTIPTAVNLPYPEFDKNVARLPADKDRPIIFFCSGVTCNMSPGSQKKAKALGYRNVRVFVEGMPGWFSRNYGVVTAQLYKDSYKDLPHVLLDARPVAEAEKEFLKGAASFPVVDAKTLKMLPKKELKAPVIVYDADGAGNARAVAAGIVKAGYVNVLVLSDGLTGAKGAQVPVAKGKLATTIAYVPKPKAGEFPLEQFQKFLTAIPEDVIILDVRTREEVKEGALKGSINIPAEELDQRYVELPKEKRIIAICPTGTRGEMAYLTLKAKGFTQASFLNAKVDFDGDTIEVTK